MMVPVPNALKQVNLVLNFVTAAAIWPNDSVYIIIPPTYQFQWNSTCIANGNTSSVICSASPGPGIIGQINVPNIVAQGQNASITLTNVYFSGIAFKSSGMPWWIEVDDQNG
jgi:hypothetical protein